MAIQKVALLTAGGFAPCLSAAVGGLIETYTDLAPDVEIIAYRYGYTGLLLGDSIVIDADARENAGLLNQFGGSPIGNSRVKLTNTKDCVKRGLIAEGENALEVAAAQLKKDDVDILHTIGGDDTNTTAADLAKYLNDNDYGLTVVGLPKTIDNDIVPIRHSLGALTAAEQSAMFARNIFAEHAVNPRMLIVHEVMGRNCGWLTAAAALNYMTWHEQQRWVPSIGLSAERWKIHAIYVPEVAIDIDAEAGRLRQIMDEVGNVNIFVSEGAGVKDIVAAMEAEGEAVEHDAFGHVRLDTINPGQYFANQFGRRLDAAKTLVQKSGYFARSAPAGEEDLFFVKQMTDMAVGAALRGQSGVIGHDEERGDTLRPIEFERIAGGKSFNPDIEWYGPLLEQIGQPMGARVTVDH